MRPKHQRGAYDVYRPPVHSYRRPHAQMQAASKSVDGIKQRQPTHPSTRPTAVHVTRSQDVTKSQARTIQRPATRTHASGHTTRAKRSQWKSTMLFTMAALLFVVGGFVSYNGWRTNKQVAAWVHERSNGETGAEGEAVSDDETIPDENQPSGSVGSYIVAADLPRVLRIGELKISARIKPLGVNNKNQLKAPSNIHDVGWYDASAKPGNGGTTLLDGHVHGPTKPGIFYNLKKLKPGAVIEVERGDGQKITYEVVKTQKYQADDVDMAAAMTPAIEGKEALNLITCTGALDKRNNSYEERLVVFAVRTN
jgi:LPXTG-site transpeptidase (sortase) family protein